MSKSLNEQLHSAASSGDTPTVLRLISKGANVNARGFFGRTPLMSAAAYNHPETVKALLDRGADASLPDNRGIPPAQAASMNGHTKVVEVLRSHRLEKLKAKGKVKGKGK